VDRNEEDGEGLDEVKFETSEHEDDNGEDMSKAIEVSIDLTKNTPLLWAAHKGKLGVIWHLLEDGYSPNDVDKMDNNALHLAAAHGDLKILKVLIDDGGVANVVNHYKNHPIDMSKTKEVRDMIAVAAEVGASMTEKDIAEKHEKNVRQVSHTL
jgi:ankyrin repeat protein